MSISWIQFQYLYGCLFPHPEHENFKKHRLKFENNLALFSMHQEKIIAEFKNIYSVNFKSSFDIKESHYKLNLKLSKYKNGILI